MGNLQEAQRSEAGVAEMIFHTFSELHLKEKKAQMSSNIEKNVVSYGCVQLRDDKNKEIIEKSSIIIMHRIKTSS